MGDVDNRADVTAKQFVAETVKIIKNKVSTFYVKRNKKNGNIENIYCWKMHLFSLHYKIKQLYSREISWKLRGTRDFESLCNKQLNLYITLWNL